MLQFLVMFGFGFLVLGGVAILANKTCEKDRRDYLVKKYGKEAVVRYEKRKGQKIA